MPPPLKFEITGQPEHFDDMLSQMFLPTFRNQQQTPVSGRVEKNITPGGPLAMTAQNTAAPSPPPPPQRGALGNIAHGLGVAGQIAGSAFIPNLMPFIPGTQQFKDIRQERQQQMLDEQARRGEMEARIADERSQIPLREAETEHLRAETDVLRNPEAKPPVTVETGTGQRLQFNPTTGNYDILVGGPRSAAKEMTPEQQAFDSYIKQGLSPEEAYRKVLSTREEVKPEKTGTFEEQTFNEWKQTHPNGTRLQFEREQVAAKKDTGPMQEARTDRSYQFHLSKMETLEKPIQDRAERISRIDVTLSQGTPQADALVAPELLSIMAGGAGSGIRMNEAEIARIVGGRTAWETIRAKLNAWQADPNKGFQLTPAQREQTKRLFGAVRQKVDQKLSAVDDAHERFVESDNVQDHKRIFADLEKKLHQIDVGTVGATVAPKAGDMQSYQGANYRFDGKVWRRQ